MRPITFHDDRLASDTITTGESETAIEEQKAEPVQEVAASDNAVAVESEDVTSKTPEGAETKTENVDKKAGEEFRLNPDVYLMKGNNMSSNPDTKSYLVKDVFTFISYTINKENLPEDTAQFKIIELAEGDTGFYSKGMFILNRVVKNPDNEKYHFKPDDLALMADITFISKDSMHYKASPLVHIDQYGLNQVDDTVYAQNLYVKFAGVTENKARIGIKESDMIIEYVTLKAYIFPHINLVWLGLIIMSIGIVMSAVQRAKLSPFYGALALIASAAGLFYMFLLAN